MRSKHLTEEALLGLAGNRLSGNALRVVEEHLTACATCRQEYEEFQFAHSVVRRMTEIGYQEALGAPAQNSVAPVQHSKKRSLKESDFPWGPVVSIVFGCICVMAILFYPRLIPTASAAELLSNAMQYENRGGDAKAFRVQVSGQICANGRTSEKMVSFDSSVRCGRALQHIQNTPWGHGNPLSARIYAMWRNSLHRRHDRVTKLDKLWEIQTTTDEGTVHTASLELRAKDYHTTELTLDFADNEKVSISEDTEPLPRVLIAEDIATTARVSKPQPRYIDNPGDLLEVQAWTTLHQLNADSGWEAIVLRNGPEVRVKAVVPDDSRKQVLEKGFAAYPGIQLEIHFLTNPGDIRDVFPDRVRMEEDAPALATPWLRQQFANADARAEFSTQTLHFSQEILGRAFILNKLKQRQAALAHCSRAREMDELVVAEKRALLALEIELSANIKPMLGAPSGSSFHVLTLAEAMRLDASLQELLWGSSDSTSATFDTSVQEVRRLLMRN